MSAAKFKVGDRVRLSGQDDRRTVVVAEPDPHGRIVLANRDGSYFTNYQSDYELAHQRFTVELRAPKKGERYAFHNGVVVADYDYDSARPVIVDEVAS